MNHRRRSGRALLIIIGGIGSEGYYSAATVVAGPTAIGGQAMKMDTDQKIADEALAALKRLRASPDTDRPPLSGPIGMLV